jgi:hypothetical protein
MAQQFGNLYLIPTPLGETSLETIVPKVNLQLIDLIEYFIAENAKTARAFLKQAGISKPLQSLHISELNEHTTGNCAERIISAFVSRSRRRPRLRSRLPRRRRPRRKPGQTRPRTPNQSRPPSRPVVDFIGAHGQRLKRPKILLPRLPSRQQSRTHYHIKTIRNRIRQTQTNPTLHRNPLPQQRHARRYSVGLQTFDATMRRLRPHYAKRNHPHPKHRAMAEGNS